MALIFNRQTRDAGTWTSPSIPSTLLPQGTITVTGLLDPADLADVALVIRLAIEANDDPSGNLPWYTLMGSVWHGGRVDRIGNPIPPIMVYSSGVVTAQRVRGVLDINKRIRIGLDVVVS